MNVTFAFIPIVIALTSRPAFIVMIVGLVVAAVIFAGALVLFQRRGMSRKQVFLLTGSVIGAALLFTPLLSLGVPSQGIVFLGLAFFFLSNVLKRRSQGRCGRSGRPQNQ